MSFIFLDQDPATNLEAGGVFFVPGASGSQTLYATAFPTSGNAWAICVSNAAVQLYRIYFYADVKDNPPGCIPDALKTENDRAVIP